MEKREWVDSGDASKVEENGRVNSRDESRTRRCRGASKGGCEGSAALPLPTKDSGALCIVAESDTNKGREGEVEPGNLSVERRRTAS